MHGIVTLIKKLSLGGTVLVLSSFSMLLGSSMAFADDTPPPCVAPADSTYGSGVHHPVGADAAAFTYQCSGPYAGKWTSQYYVYDPATTVQSPLYSPDYSYDCTTHVWTMTQWTYNPVKHAYAQSRVVPATAPNLPTGCAPPPTTAATPASTTITGTGTGSTNTTGSTASLNDTTTNDTALAMANGVTSTSTSGDASVTGNTTAGSATSGGASAITTVANLLQSTSNVLGPNTVVFTADINGDVNGDILLDPSAILNTGTGSTNTTDNKLQVNTSTTNDTDASIINTINTGATSGDATVAGNTTAGSATSGDATAIVNLLNLINSTVAAGQSFIGTININGNLNGDILLPQSVIDQLLANTGTGSTNTANTTLTNNSTTTNTTSESIANNITSSAASGDAAVTGNTTAGSATSGLAGTNVTVLNLTGSNTVGKDDLLVFVNVLGQWVGMIVNAPTGATTADLGSNITGTGTGSSNSLGTDVTDNSTTTNTTSESITNNVNVSAQSGDATVYHNTTAGNATSGNAYTAVNILNMEGSNISLSDWFGVLFINVFGIWNGSFGLNTAAGDPVTNPTYNPVQAASQQSMVSAARQFAAFVPHSSGSSAPRSNQQPAVSLTSAILGTSNTRKILHTTGSSLPTPDNGTHASFLLPALGLGCALALLLASERDRLFRHK